ncbi:MobA/MobL family protein [Pseudoxanthomonas sp.]|uniref:MobA/MobL family protein n=1 Tax=Pseudoxanthomonas sp. TaxID=1871049 RepID=UPI0035ADB8FF
MASFHHCIKSGKRGSAVAHSTYISNEDRDDLIYTSQGNLPEWAKGSIRLFWRMANAHERANGAVYREHEIALPNELTREELIELAERLVRELVGTKPYQFAIHAPDGRIGGISNPHIHLMYSDRVPDGINRTPEQMFSRFNSKRPEAGGCRKDSGGRSPLELRNEVIFTRKMIADLQNQALAEHGHDSCVDHRSLREQGLRRRPERHLGPARVRDLTADERAQFTEFRGSEGQTPDP